MMLTLVSFLTHSPSPSNPDLPCQPQTHLQYSPLYAIPNRTRPSTLTSPNIIQRAPPPQPHSPPPFIHSSQSPTHTPPWPLNSSKCFKTVMFASMNRSTQFAVQLSSPRSKLPDPIRPVTHLRQQMSVRAWTAVFIRFVSGRSMRRVSQDKEKMKGGRRRERGGEEGERTLLDARLLRFVDDELL